MAEGIKQTVVFNALDREADIQVSERNLPHWFQVGAATFVTFRTADSLPGEVLLRMERELHDWLDRNGLPKELAHSQFDRKPPTLELLLGQIPSTQRREFKMLCDQLFHRSLDECHGACLFKKQENAKFVADAILNFDGERYDLDSFVIMPNHVHAIVQFRAGFDLDTIGQSWMRFTARVINKQIGREGVLWQPEPFDHIIRSPEQFSYLHRYIADNPKKANLCDGEYIYWKRTM